MNSKPIVELVRDVSGVPVLHLYYLNAEQMLRLKDIMSVNGDTTLHQTRSLALAHMSQCDSEHGIAAIHLHGEHGDYYTQFNAMLSTELGLTFPNVPICDVRMTA